jgi:hypothetical protein
MSQCTEIIMFIRRCSLQSSMEFRDFKLYMSQWKNQHGFSPTHLPRSYFSQCALENRNSVDLSAFYLEFWKLLYKIWEFSNCRWVNEKINTDFPSTHLFGCCLLHCAFTPTVCWTCSRVGGVQTPSSYPHSIYVNSFFDSTVVRRQQSVFRTKWTCATKSDK